MGYDAEDAEAEFAEALADGRLAIASSGEIYEPPRPATGRAANNSDWVTTEEMDDTIVPTKPSPFYNEEDNPQLQKGAIRHAALEPINPNDLTQGFQLVDDKPAPKLFEKTAAADNYEDIYYRLDRAIANVESNDELQRQQGIDDLYELRDLIYRGLR